MPISNMIVYNEQIRLRTIEKLAHKMDLFNGASGGAIQLSAEGYAGDFTKESFFTSILSAKRRVDRYIANAAAAATELNQQEKVGVKVAGAFGPVVFEPSQMTWLQSKPKDAIDVIADGFAEALMVDHLYTSLGAVIAAVENNAGVKHDVSAVAGAAGGLSQVALNQSHAKFGDSSSMLVTDIMTGAAYHKLVEKGLQNGERLFEAGNVTVQSILGKRVVVADVPQLTTGVKTKVLSLSAGAVIVDNTGDLITNMETRNGKQRIETTFQADYAFGIKVKGYAWDIASGGKSPTDAELFTGTNWDKVVLDNKNTAGTILIADLTK